MAQMRIIAASLAAAFMAGAGAPAWAGPGAAEAQAGMDMRLSVITPLMEDLRAATPRPPGAQLELGSASLRFDADIPDFSTRQDETRPGASRLASAILSARAPEIARDMLSGFEASETLISATPSGGRLTLSLMDAEAPSAMVLAFGPDFAEAAGRALTGERERPRRMALRYEGAFDSTGSDGLDFGLSPRAGVSFGDYGPAAQAGATVRLGRFIGEDAGQSRPAWWLFAGADRQALLYDPGAGFTRLGAFTVAPYALVGDAQAGVAMRMGGADLSLAYIRRETSYSLPAQSWDTQEGFAAFSLTLRR
ncbi:lipid A-modifier LpxR family protein [Alkalicaulis satelles]|nr:lipid A-modifier LpxR family protein [Alkalicaulis satelles]